MNSLPRLLLLLSILQIIDFLPNIHVKAACPNSCNLHGTCGTNGVCSCFTGWDFAVDCSQRTCPSGPAWADKAYATDAAHSMVECAGAGICDRSSGVCQCFEGYTGAACRRSDCPNDCSDNGVCMTIQDAGLYLGSDYSTVPGSVGGDGIGPKYTNWDHSSIGVCNCDMGFFGPDCSRRMCPKNDDPVTINQNSRKIMVRLNGDGHSFGGKLKVSFLGHTAEFGLGSQLTTAYCKQQWEKLSNVDKVSCLVEEGNSHTALLEGRNTTFNVTFNSFPIYPSENNFFSHTGNPPLAAFTCDTSEVTVAGGSSKSCVIKDLVNADVKEYEFCSRRGTCDFTSGLCYCFSGYSGMDCASLAYSLSSANSEPALGATAVGNDYVGNVLELQSEKGASADFKFLSAKADGTEVFSISGEGQIAIGELKVVETGATIEQGGLIVSNGGV
ncbi:hypothetical protein ScalyP_jg5472, partial [Parmales sp. scaly parma]